MTVIALGSVRGAPGVTTAAMLLAAAIDDAIVVEADLNGGVIAVRYALGREPGLTTLAAERPAEGDGWTAHAQLAGETPVMVGPDSPDGARALWHSAGERLEAHLDRFDATVVADLGRLVRGSPVLAVAGLTLVLAQPTAEHLVALNHRLSWLRDASRGPVGVVLVGSGPYRSADLEPWGVEVLGTLPDDPRAATAMCEGGPALLVRRSLLARSAMTLAADLSAGVALTGAEP
jgi:hypothetical protein